MKLVGFPINRNSEFVQLMSSGVENGPIHEIRWLVQIDYFVLRRLIIPQELHIRGKSKQLPDRFSSLVGPKSFLWSVIHEERKLGRRMTTRSLGSLASGHRVEHIPIRQVNDLIVAQGYVMFTTEVPHEHFSRRNVRLGLKNLHHYPALWRRHELVFNYRRPLGGWTAWLIMFRQAFSLVHLFILSDHIYF